MAVTANFFGRHFEGQYGGTAARRIDWAADTIKVVLTTSAYTPDQDAHDFYNDVTNELSTAGGYTAGGATLGSRTVNYDTGTNRTQLRAATTSWTSATFTANKAVVYSDTAGASTTDPLIVYVQFGADQTVSSGTFSIAWDATDGVGYIAAS